MTVPPRVFLTRLNSPRSARTKASRRWGPISTLNGVLVAETPASSIFPVAPIPRSTWRGPRRAARKPRTISGGLVRRSRIASLSRSRSEGSGLGAHLGGRSGGGGGSSSRSNRTVVMSTPETPSTSAWWLLPTIANRSPSRPSTSHSSHSGFERSSCWEKIREARLRSCSSEPGAGSAVWRTWYSRLRWGSSTQTGRPWPKGTKRSFWRKRGTRCRRDSMWSRNSSWLGGEPSKMITEATCMWAPPRSMWRNAVSSPVRRSAPMQASSHDPCVMSHCDAAHSRGPGRPLRCRVHQAIHLPSFTASRPSALAA